MDPSLNGFTLVNFPVTYPQGTNNTPFFTGRFLKDYAIVVSFTTPAASDGRTKILSTVQIGTGSFNHLRHMTLDTVARVGGGIKSLYSNSPNITMKIGTPTGPFDTNTYLKPSTTYYVTLVNRNPDGTSSTQDPNNEMRVDFNN